MMMMMMIIIIIIILYVLTQQPEALVHQGFIKEALLSKT